MPLFQASNVETGVQPGPLFETSTFPFFSSKRSLRDPFLDAFWKVIGDVALYVPVLSNQLRFSHFFVLLPPLISHFPPPFTFSAKRKFVQPPRL